MQKSKRKELHINYAKEGLMKKIKKILPFVFLGIMCLVILAVWKNLKFSDVNDLITAQKIHPYEIDMEEDSDGDSIINSEELKIGTDYNTPDTDGDGLNDYIEHFLSKTNPKKTDTDGDSLSDYVEVLAGLDPNKSLTDGKKKDKDTKFEKTYEVEDCSLKVCGNAKIFDIYVDKQEDQNVYKQCGVVSELYEFYMDGQQDFDSAELSIRYDKDVVESFGYNEENLSIFQFMNDGTFNKVDSVVDKENGTVYAELKHFSKYVIADGKFVNARGEKQKKDIFLLIDNSGSMYPKELCEDSNENDVNFKRLDLANNIIANSDEFTTFGLAKFTGTYTEFSDGFNVSNEELLKEIEGIRTKEETFDGTAIADSVSEALKAFDKSPNKQESSKYLILLTDGETTSWFEDIDEIKREAREKKVTIITIGLGNQVDVDYLKEFSDEYIYANNADALDSINEIINTSINYSLADLDADGINDAICVADSGFDVQKDAFSFTNFILKSHNDTHYGQCFGMAIFSQLYYVGKLPLNDEAVPEHKAGGLFNRVKLKGLSYDLRNIEFFSGGNSEADYASSKNNLYDYELLNGILDYRKMETEKAYTYKKLGLFKPANLILNDKTQNIVDESIIAESLKRNTTKPQLLKDYTLFNSYEEVFFNMDNVNTEKLNEDDLETYNVLACINNLYSLQGYEEDVFRIYNIPGLEIEEDSYSKPLKNLINDLQDGKVPVVCATGHAVNAIRIYRDIENPKVYWLILYDNNQPDKEKVIKIVEKRVDKSLKGYWDHGINMFLNDYLYSCYDTQGVFGNKADTKISVSFNIHKSID